MHVPPPEAAAPSRAADAPAAAGRPAPTLARRWLQLVAGLFGYALAVVLMIQSGLGLGPWDAFHYGLHRLTGVTVGVASIAAGVVIVLGTLLLHVRPGAGTLANMVLIGWFVDLLLPHWPPARHWLLGLGYYLPAIAVAGLATGMYIGAGLGAGPRDGLMVVLAQRSGWPVRRVRTGIEVLVLALGWLMGGTLGVGTVLFTFGIGPAAQWGLARFGVLRRPEQVAPPFTEAEAV